MAIRTVADLVTNAYTSAPIVTSQQYRNERENVQNAITKERNAVSSNPPAMTFGAPSVNPAETKPQGQGSAPFSGSMVAPPRTDYAENISSAERQRTPSGQRVSSQDRINDVVGLVRQGFTNPEELQRYLNVSQAGGLASGYTVDEIRNIVASNADAVKQGEQYRREAVTGGVTQQLTEEERAMKAIEDLQKQRQQRFNQQQEYLNRQFDQVAQQAQESQRREMGNVNVQLARMGAFTAASGVDYGMKVQERHRRELGEIESRRQGALFNAQDAFEKEELQLAYKNLELAKAAKKERDDAKARQLDELKKYEDIRKIQSDNAITFFQSLVSKGKTLEDLPEGYLEITYPELKETDIASAFSIAQDKAETAKMDAEIKRLDLETKRYTAENRPIERKKALLDLQNTARQMAVNTQNQVKTLQELMAKQPKGLPLVIDDASYFGIDGGAVFEATNDGVGRLLYKDPKTGENRVMNMEFVGDPQDLVTVYQNGVPILVNKRTGQQAPVTRGVPGQQPDAAIEWENYFPPGSKGGQCGEFVHNLVADYPYGLDTIEQKRSAINVPKGQMPMVGDVLVQNTGGKWGHVAIVNWVGMGANGGPVMRLTESNRGLDERVTHTTTVPVTSPTVEGFFRGSLRPGLEFGSDAPTRRTEPVAPTEQPRKELTFSPSPFTAGRMSEAQFNAANEKEQSAREAAMLVADKTSTFEEATKGLPAAVVNRTRRILEENKVNTRVVTSGLAPQSFDTWVREREQELGQSLKPEVAKEQYAEYEKQQNSVKTVMKAISRGKHTKEERAMFIEQANDALQSGDLASLEDLALQTARKNMSDSERGKMDTSRNLVDSYNEARAKLESFANDPDFASGNLKRIFEKAKKKGSFASDARYTALEQLLSTFQNEYKNKITGASLTPQEQELAEKYTISLDFDTAEDAWNKLHQGAKVHQFIADAYVANALGTPRPKLSDYLNANK